MARRSVHDEVREMLGAFADGELTRRKHRLVAAHVSSCQWCQSDLALQRSLAQALQRELVRVAPPKLRLRVQRLTKSLTPPATRLPRRRE